MKAAILWSASQLDHISVGEAKKMLYKDIIEKNINNHEFSKYFATLRLSDIDFLFAPGKDDNETAIRSLKNLNAYDAFFILAELDWGKSNPSDFGGISLVKNMRKEGISAPIFICSAVAEKDLIVQFNATILAFRGHYFIHLPGLYSQTRAIEPLDPFELDYCKTHLCDLEGAIRDIYHKKQHVLNIQDLEKGRSMFGEILNSITSLPGLPDKIVERIRHRQAELKNASEIADIHSLVKQDESVLLEFLSDRETEKKNISEIAIGNWEVLILDDVPEDVKNLIESLEAHGLKNRIHTAENYHQAVEIIEKDINNFITIVISDFKLETTENGISYLTGKQGYSFVQWLSRQNRFNEIYVFSGLARSFLKTTFKRFKIRVNVVSKYEVNTKDKTQSLVEEIIEKGNEIYNSILNLPECSGWDGINYYYSYHRNRFDYLKWEEEISRNAREVVTQIKYLREKAELMGLRESELAKFPLFSKIKTFPNLRGRLFMEVKNDNVLPSDAIVTRAQKSNHIVKTLIWNDPEKRIPKANNKTYYEEYFINKMIARRIAWWLLFCEGIHINTVFSLLNSGEYFNDYFNIKEKEKDGKQKADRMQKWKTTDEHVTPETFNAKSLVYSMLAVVKNDFPSRLLIEEKNWFKYDMGVDLGDIISVISGFEDYFLHVFEKFYHKMNHKRPEFELLKKRFYFKDRFLFFSANDIRKAFELAFNSLDNPADKKALIYEIMGRLNENDKICNEYMQNVERFAISQLKIFEKR